MRRRRRKYHHLPVVGLERDCDILKEVISLHSSLHPTGWLTTRSTPRALCSCAEGGRTSSETSDERRSKKGIPPFNWRFKNVGSLATSSASMTTTRCQPATGLDSHFFVALLGGRPGSTSSTPTPLTEALHVLGTQGNIYRLLRGVPCPVGGHVGITINTF